MKSIKYFLHLILFVGIVITFNTHYLCAQETEEAIVDSTTVKPETIALADISIESGEGFITTKRIVESLIPKEQLDRIPDAFRKVDPEGTVEAVPVAIPAETDPG